MKKNPLKEHRIGATGCDGTILGLINSRHTTFKYSVLREAEFKEIFRLLGKLAIGNSQIKVMEKLFELIEGLESKVNRGNKDLDEAQLCMDTLKNVIENCSAQIDEQIK